MSDIAASGECNACGAEACEEWPEDADAGAHTADEFPGCGGLQGIGGVEEQFCGSGPGDCGAHGQQQLQHGVDIIQFGHIVQVQITIYSECGGHSRERGVFAAADGDCATQRNTTADFQPTRHYDSIR
ncbi:hypothetical protein LBMAG46_22410 [Planctomycetia bacterium]|nr:hypothetical protein LBMAG46_22410 [Planctomycetia bacterium]